MLRQATAELARFHDPRILVGIDTADDAGVVRLDDERALVQTVDFITPIVDDPEAFGAVAAANSLSDVYAMGGRPLTAMNVVCFPEDEQPVEVLSAVLRGAAAACAEAGCLVVGGHSVADPEFKFGLSITGLVHPDRVVRNSTARAGDCLVLTKPLGTGILATALKRGRLAAPEAAELLRWLRTLNAAAAAHMVELGVHACTDITGFGLVGHAAEMATGSRARLVLRAASLPILPSARELARKGHLTRGDTRNREYVAGRFRLAGRVADDVVAVAFDAQTSGGLLVALPAGGAEDLVGRVPGAAVIGEVEAGDGEVVLGD